MKAVFWLPSILLLVALGCYGSHEAESYDGGVAGDSTEDNRDRDADTATEKGDVSIDSTTDTSAGACKPKVCKGTEVVSAQDLEDLDDCTSIDGDLIFSRSSSTKRVRELDDLHCLETINGDLAIAGDITSVSGLNELTSISGFLYIVLSSLEKVNGLNNLESVGGSLHIEHGIELTDLDGLSGLTVVGGDLVLLDCEKLTSLDGLSSLTSINGKLTVKHASELPTCEVYELGKRAGIKDEPESFYICGTKADECGDLPCPLG